MREIHDHKVNGLNEALNVVAFGPPGRGNANVRYNIEGPLGPPAIGVALRFQEGPVSRPEDINGISNEALLAVVIDRMRGFQTGPFACSENALALTKLEEAMMWLRARTRDRMVRGVEGKLEP